VCHDGTRCDYRLCCTQIFAQCPGTLDGVHEPYRGMVASSNVKPKQSS
jgi:hypothetical protein